MRYLQILAAVLCAAIATAQGLPWAADRQAAVVKIVCQDRDGAMSLGSGTYLGGKYIASAWHVFRDAGSFHIRDRQDQPIANGTRVITSDAQDDVVLVEIDRELQIPPAPIAQSEPQVGADVYFAGFARGRDFRIHTGRITGPAGQGSLWGSSGSISGESGGPVFNANGELVGPISASDHVRDTVFASAAVTRRVCSAAIEARQRCIPMAPQQPQIPIQPPVQQPQQPQAPITISSADIVAQLKNDPEFFNKLSGHLKACPELKGDKGDKGDPGKDGGLGPPGKDGAPGADGKDATFSDQQIASIVAMAAAQAAEMLKNGSPTKPSDQGESDADARWLYFTSKSCKDCGRANEMIENLKSKGAPITVITLSEKDAATQGVPMIFIPKTNRRIVGLSNVISYLSMVTY
jgi:hypothetical protein